MKTTTFTAALLCIALVPFANAAPKKVAKPDPGAEEIATAQDAMKRLLKDPDSAQFRDMRFIAETGVVCGQVNAKNSYGGYVGFTWFARDNDGKMYQLRTDPNRISGADAGDRMHNIRAAIDMNYKMGQLCPNLATE